MDISPGFIAGLVIVVAIIVILSLSSPHDGGHL